MVQWAVYKQVFDYDYVVSNAKSISYDDPIDRGMDMERIKESLALDDNDIRVSYQDNVYK